MNPRDKRSVFFTLLAAGMICLCSSVRAQTLYALSIRVYSDASYSGIEGNLYRVDPTTAVTSLVAPLRLDGRESIGLDGLAINPRSGEFFGVTAQAKGPIPHSLVRLDPKTGAVTLIGDLGVFGTDITFDRAGSLFIWLPKTSQVGRVDLETGKVTPVGTPHPAMAPDGAIEVLSEGGAVLAASGGLGTLDRIDVTTGAITPGVQLKGAHYPQLIAGLAESPDGTLLAVNANAGIPALADLVSIDKKTGQISIIGPLPNDTDAIAFGPSMDARKEWDLNRWRVIVFPILLATAVVAAIVLVRERARARKD